MEDGYEFFAKRQLVTLFSAPNYCGEFDNAGAMMSVDETLMCSFQVGLSFSELVLVLFVFACKQWCLHANSGACMQLRLCVLTAACSLSLPVDIEACGKEKGN